MMRNTFITDFMKSSKRIIWKEFKTPKIKTKTKVLHKQKPKPKPKSKLKRKQTQTQNKSLIVYPKKRKYVTGTRYTFGLIGITKEENVQVEIPNDRSKMIFFDLFGTLKSNPKPKPKPNNNNNVVIQTLAKEEENVCKETKQNNNNNNNKLIQTQRCNQDAIFDFDTNSFFRIKSDIFYYLVSVPFILSFYLEFLSCVFILSFYLEFLS